MSRDIGSEKPWRPLRLSYRLAVIAVLIVATLSSTNGDCPDENSHCICRTENDHDNLYCQNFGYISQVPCFGCCKALYKLQIRGGTILSTVQIDAFKCVYVNVIELRDLGITSIEQSAFYYKETVEVLILNNNSLSTISHEGFSGLVSLKNLGLNNNRLTTVNDSFIHMSQLERLDLGQNRLETIPDDTFNAFRHSLKELYLHKNRLTSVSATLFSFMENLEKLVLHDNELEAIPQDAFKGLNQLWYLDLSNNRLTSVCTYLVSHLTRLERLYFNNNQIETIPNDAFKRLNQSLKYLYVHNNRLSSVNPALFSHLPQLRELSLRGNHLVCDCRLAWLRKKRMIIQDHPLCFSPAPVNGIPVTSYNISKCYPLTVPDHWLMIGCATLSGAFAVALGASILALIKRMQRAMCRRAEAEVDPFTHNLPQTRNTTLALHETIAAPAPTYETVMGPLSTNPPEMDFETKNM